MDSNPQRTKCAPVFKTGSFPIRIISNGANDWSRTSISPPSRARVDHKHFIGISRRPRLERGRSDLESERLPLPHRRKWSARADLHGCIAGLQPASLLSCLRAQNKIGDRRFERRTSRSQGERSNP